MARLLIAEGADVAAIDSQGKTPLGIAEEWAGIYDYVD
jgi:ankyrin repeat protein